VMQVRWAYPAGRADMRRILPTVPVPLVEPMLATNRAPNTGYRWAVEPKLDGWRALVYVDGGVRVRTRRGRDVTASLPELAGLAEQVPDGTILDGELVAGGGRSADFYSVGPSMAARRRRAPLAFVVFDVPHLAGEPTTGLIYRNRRRLLELLELNGPAWCTVPSFDAEAEEVLEECARLRLEGLVAKRVDSRYEAGKRSRMWLKVKSEDWREHHAPLRHER
jgi:bifunctional non-homologous end joining protein LigD